MRLPLLLLAIAYTLLALGAVWHHTDGHTRAAEPRVSPSVPPAPPETPAAQPGPSEDPPEDPVRAARTHTRTPQASLGVEDVTAYCGTGHRTASGSWPQPGDAATLDRRIPFGTLLDIPGVGRVVVTDRIGTGSDVDLYMGGPDCARRADTWGRRHLPVTVIRWGGP